MTSDREKSTEETILAYKSLWGLEEDSWEGKVISGLMLSRVTELHFLKMLRQEFLHKRE